ncbi:hypothetical protein M2168_006388 [Streptomyces sp. CZ24]|uniref:DUF6009 family protein n=1 Tax=Streptomyces albidoflavus TaxID=1886 RepID=UPI0004CB7A66|nr:MULTISPECIES: DUF6009 family protein [Streptomyces]MDH6193270.1 hypothetical protein [Streptomyces sp. CZ24]
MSSLLHESQLVHESTLVWLEDPDNFDYVRQALDKTGRRTGKPRYARDGRMVGYAELDREADASPDSGLFQRRTFFLLPHDRPDDPEGPYEVGAPGEAVDPRTLQPKRVGEKTPRSQGEPKPTVR